MKVSETVKIVVLNYNLSELTRIKEDNETLKQILSNQMYIMQMLLEKEGLDVQHLDRKASEWAKNKLLQLQEEENNE